MQLLGRMSTRCWTSGGQGGSCKCSSTAKQHLLTKTHLEIKPSLALEPKWTSGQNMCYVYVVGRLPAIDAKATDAGSECFDPQLWGIKVSRMPFLIP